MLPMRHGAWGLHMQSGNVLDAALVADAGQAERNLKGRPAALVICKGLAGPPCGSGGAASTHGTWSSASGTHWRKTCERISWTAGTGCLGRSSF